jgi:hypothetical protein
LEARDHLVNLGVGCHSGCRAAALAGVVVDVEREQRAGLLFCLLTMLKLSAVGRDGCEVDNLDALVL